MKIHNYGNDYVQANKFKNESVSNVENQTTDDRPKPTEEVSTVVSEVPEETITEEKENRRGRKKKQSD